MHAHLRRHSGGLDGLESSTTWIYEACLGWRGILIEGHPTHFARLNYNRPTSLNLRFAACASDRGYANYSARSWGGAGVLRAAPEAVEEDEGKRHVGSGGGLGPSVLRVACRTVGAALQQYGVSRLDLFSLDVEGAEWDG